MNDNIKSGYSVDEKFYKRQKERHFKIMEAKAVEAQDKNVFNHVPNEEEVTEENNLIKLLVERTQLSQEEIIDSLSRLIEKAKLISAETIYPKKRFYRKNHYSNK